MMKKNIMNNERGGAFTLLGLLLALAIICFLIIKMFSGYTASESLDKETKKSLSKEGINLEGPKKILDSTRDIIKQSNKSTQKIEEVK